MAPPVQISDEKIFDKPSNAVGDDERMIYEKKEKVGVQIGVEDIIPMTKNNIELHPTPTSDPLDPLNWTKFRKHSILAIVMAFYFMFTYITTTTVPSFPELQVQYNISINLVNWTVAIPALGLAIGPLIWSSIADIYGRRIIFMAGTLIAFAATIGAAKAPSYGGYMAARFFQGIGTSPAATVGLAIINDVFFDHERGQKIGFWVLAIDVGIYFGPLIGGFMDLVDHFWIQWLNAIFFGTIFIAELFFLPETLYPRNHMLIRMPYSNGLTKARTRSIAIEKTARRQSIATEVSTPRTTSLGFVNLKPVPGLRHPKAWDSLVRFLKLFKFPVVSLTVLMFCFGWYWWILSIITMIPSAYARYSPQVQGLLFISLILGTLFTEIFCSGRLSDHIVLKLAQRNGDVKVAEMRLWLVYPAALLSATGLVIWGLSIDKGYHWMVGQVAFFLFSAGIQMGNTAVASYIIDCYPLQCMSIVTFYSVVLNLSAFINPFFILSWVTSIGYTWTFAVQGIIVFFFCIPGFAAIHRFGPWLREKGGVPSWVNPEYDIL